MFCAILKINSDCLRTHRSPVCVPSGSTLFLSEEVTVSLCVTQTDYSLAWTDFSLSTSAVPCRYHPIMLHTHLHLNTTFMKRDNEAKLGSLRHSCAFIVFGEY
jgi:hypothetical protein